MKKLRKILAVIIAAAMLFGMAAFTAAAGTAAEHTAERNITKIVDNLSAVEQLITNIRNFFANIKYMFMRFKSNDITVEATNAYDIGIAKNGESIRLMNDISAPDIYIDDAVNLDMNGHTLKCNSFTYVTYSGGTYTIKNGTIDVCGGGDVSVIAPNATLMLPNVTVKLVSDENKFTVDASVNTVYLNDNFKVIYVNSSTTGTVYVEGDTRVVISETITIPVSIAVKGSNVIIENGCTAVQPDTLPDGSENPDAGKSIVTVAVDNTAADNIVITNTAVETAAEIVVVVPDTYTNYINIVDSEGCAATAVSVVNNAGEEVSSVVNNGKLPSTEALVVTAASSAEAVISGLNATIMYEYRACHDTEFTALPVGTESFTTGEKHLFVRLKAFGNYEAGDEYEVKTGLADPVKTVYIGCIDELKLFRDSVNSGSVFTGYTVYLTGDINLNNEEWVPIGFGKAFKCTFDGQGHTISNLKVSGTQVSTAANNTKGFFGSANGAVIKNLNINNADVSGSLYVGALIGNGTNVKITNVNITGDIKINAWWYASACAGNGYCTIADVNVNANPGSKVEISGGYAGGIIGFSGEGARDIINNCSSNIDVYGQYNGIGGLTGILHYGNRVVNSTCSGNVINTTTEAGEEIVTGGICGSYNSTSTQFSTITNCTFTGTVYHNDAIHPCMSTHPMYGGPWGNKTTYVIVVDGVTCK